MYLQTLIFFCCLVIIKTLDFLICLLKVFTFVQKATGLWTCFVCARGEMGPDEPCIFCTSLWMSDLILGHTLSPRHETSGILNESSKCVPRFSSLWESGSQLFSSCVRRQQKYHLSSLNFYHLLAVGIRGVSSKQAQFLGHSRSWGLYIYMSGIIRSGGSHSRTFSVYNCFEICQFCYLTCQTNKLIFLLYF